MLHRWISRLARTGLFALALGGAVSAGAVALPQPYNYVRLLGSGNNNKWLEGSTPQSGFIGLDGLDGLGYAVYGAASTSFDNGGTVRVAASINGVQSTGSVEPSADLTYYIRLNLQPGASPAAAVPVRVQAAAWQATAGSIFGTDTLFSMQEWGTTHYLARAGVNYTVWNSQELFALNKVVMMTPGTIYSVYLHAALSGVYSQCFPPAGCRRGMQEIVVDPQFTIDAAYADAYRIEGLLSAVPEPGTAALQLTGLAGLAALRRVARQRGGRGL